jgi:hypothetical protein
MFQRKVTIDEDENDVCEHYLFLIERADDD